MATIIKEALIDAPVDAVWDAVADWGAVHRRFAPGFVANVEVEPGARRVTFGNGMVVRELFLGLDAERRRLAYSAQSERLTHHSASFQVEDVGDGRSRLTWTADVLPDAAATVVESMMEEGIHVSAVALGRTPA